MTKHIEYIDIAKGCAILLVVMGHVTIYSLYTNIENSPLHSFIYSFHMPLFIFLSGLVASSGIKANVFKDIWSRFRSLIVPGIIVGLIFSLSLGNIYKFIFDKYHDGYWYLWVLFVFVVIHTLTFNILERKVNRKLLFIIPYLVAIALWYICFRIVFSIIPLKYSDALSLPFLVMYYPYYLLATAIKRFNLLKLFNNTLVLIVCTMVCLFQSYFTFTFNEYITTTAAVVTIVSICRKLYTYSAHTCNHTRKVCSLLSMLGRNSLYIYIFHYFAFPLMNMKWLEPVLLQQPSILIDIILCFIPTLFATLLSLGIALVYIKGERLINKYLFGK